MGSTKIIIIVISLLIIFYTCCKADEQKLGVYFSKKKYIKQPIPTFAENKNKLPDPILQDNPEWIKMYWKCWEIAFQGFKSPKKKSPMVSNWLDEAFSGNIFQWDTIFMLWD